MARVLVILCIAVFLYLLDQAAANSNPITSVTNCAECHDNATCASGPTCQCNEGYEGNGTICSDINECDKTEFPNTCRYNLDESCRNLEGNHECYCAQGLIPDQIVGGCVDVDECDVSYDKPCIGPLDALNNTIGVCKNRKGFYQCICNDGYEELVVDNWNRSCVDYNECNKDPREDDCDKRAGRAQCHDFVGKHNCTCNPGWVAKNGTTEGEDCENVDECTSMAQPHGCHGNATCNDTVGSYECACDDGFTGDGFTCNDILECDDDSLNDCHRNATCNETVGSYTCECNDGFTGNGTYCENLLECDDDSLNGCDQNATCADTEGSYTCTCDTGFTGNGFNCSNFDECTISSSDPDYHDCHTNANCTDEEGSYTCVCHTGYRGDGWNCTEIDECTDGTTPHQCDTNAQCSNNNGSYDCACNVGWTGDGFNCTDIDECNGTNDCSANSNCTNTAGSYTCMCDVGYSGDALITGTNCTDIHECDTDTDDCHDNATCTNTIGSHTCRCNAGFAGDGYDVCRDILIYSGSAKSANTHQMQEENITMDGYPTNAGADTTILSVISGGTPGTIIQNSAIDEANGRIGIAFYTSYESGVMPKYDWLSVDPMAFNSSEFQYGAVPIMYQVFEKCVDVNFTETMERVPSVVVSLYATHSLEPFILDYSLVWTEGVTATGFRACVHEAVLFSGEHEAKISYVAVATNTTVYGSITEHQVVNFENGTVNHANETYLEPFCQKIFFQHRYTTPPAVFVTAENAMGSRGEQNAWIKKVTDRYVYVCTKNSIDDPGHRQVAANVSMVVAGAQPFHVCSGVDTPTNLDCYADGSGGYYFDCWTDCDEDVRFEQVCASDFGYYKSECHMMKETCEMYGKQTVGNVSVVDEGGIGCQHLLPPYAPFALDSLVETDVEDTFCQEGSFTDAIGADVGTMFHNYSDILIATSFLSATPSPFYTGVSTWVQDVNETHYTGCASVIGGGSPKEDYIMLVIYQKNLHTRIRESPWTSGIVQGGSIKLDAWKRGSQCVTNMNKMKIDVDNGTSFILTVSHGSLNGNPTYSPISVWRESVINNASMYRFCARTVDMFGVRQEGVSINWLAVQNINTTDSPIAPFMPNFNLPSFDFSNNAAHDQEPAKIQVNNDTVVQGALRGTPLVSVNNLVEENVIRDNEKRSVSFSSWIQVDDTTSELGVCYQASWPGQAFGDSMIRPVTFSMGV